MAPVPGVWLTAASAGLAAHAVMVMGYSTLHICVIVCSALLQAILLVVFMPCPAAVLAHLRLVVMGLHIGSLPAKMEELVAAAVIVAPPL